MQDGRSRGQQRLRGTATAKAEAKKSAADRLASLAKTVGNDEITRRIAQAGNNRDAMLALVAERLQMVRDLQQREVSLTRKGANWDWWRLASDAHKKDSQEPEPTRWHETARAYEAAVDAICRGDLRRGQQLLETAHEVEQRTVDELTDLVDTRELETGPAETGWTAEAVAETPTAPTVTPPLEIRALIDQILAVEQTVPEMPGRRRRRDPWWTLEEDEEEEKPDGGGGGA